MILIARLITNLIKKIKISRNYVHIMKVLKLVVVKRKITKVILVTKKQLNYLKTVRLSLAHHYHHKLKTPF
jgi:hypothetical protein